MGTRDNEGFSYRCRCVPIMNCPYGRELACAMICTDGA